MKLTGMVCSLLAFATIAVGQVNKKELVLFDASKPKQPKWNCSTCSWIKGSDFKPVTNLVDHKGEKWQKFSFEGSKGRGRALRFFKNTINKRVPEGMTARGLELTIDYPGKDFKKLQVTLNFEGGKNFVKHLPLEHGVKTYYFDRGWTRTGIPKDWSGLKLLGFFIESGFPDFYLKKILVKLHKQQSVARKLKIQRIRKVCEVLPGKNTTTLNFNDNSPFQVKLGYDKANLYVNSQAKYPSAPRAIFKSGDKVGSVWGDELTEYFFSGWNDNRKFVQFVTNLNGAVWDSITDYDRTAAMVIRRYNDWKLKHDKKITWNNNIWSTEAVFPFASLRFNPDKKRFMGFQIVQGYDKTRKGKFKTTVWSQSRSFPYPKNFGVIVFNKKKFGSGDLQPLSASSNLGQGDNKIDFLLNLKAENIRPGTYRIKKYVAAADNSFTELPSESVVINDKDQVLKIKYSECKNMNGLYSLYVALENSNGDIKLVGINFDNTKPLVSMFGKSVFCPKPKKITWHKGTFKAGGNKTLSVSANASARTLKTASIFAEKLLGYAGKYDIVKGGKDGIVLQISSQAFFNGKKVKLNPEGYCLDIKKDKVTITGADEAGLYYGCRIFLQMLRQPMKRVADAPVRCAEILDWPDLKKRFTNLLHPWQFYKAGFKEKRSVDYLINWVDRYIAGTGQNMFILHVGPIIKYKRHPEFNAANCLYSLEDLAKLAQFCRDNFIEFVPRWQTGGHAFWSLLLVHPELREKGYKHTADVTHPKHNKIVFDCMLDVIEATKCKYINVGGDEWWHSLSKKEKPDKLLRDKTRAQAFLEFHKEALKFAKNHDVEMMMHEDMVNPYHNGVRYDLYKIIDELPKDIIILPWSGGNPDRTLNYFADKGFRVWPNTTGTWFANKSRKRIGGYGASVYSFSYALPLYGRKVVVNYALNVLRGAEYAWNAYSDKLDSISILISSGLLPALMEQFAEPWNPAASSMVTPLDIRKALNTNFSKLLLKREPKKYVGKAESVKFPSGKNDVGNIPMQLIANGNNCIKVGQGDNVSLTVNSNYSSLIFLHSVRTDEQFLKDNYRKLLWRHWIYGRPAGDYIVKYADGSSAKIPLRLRDNINFAGVKPMLRPCLNIRYIMPLKDVTGNYLFLYQYEWVNPYPEKSIKSIELTQTIVDFDLLVFAVSGRKVK